MSVDRINRRTLGLGLAAPLVLAACHGKGAAGGSAATPPDDMTLGNPNAKVTVVEYASVACPVCGRWYKEVWPAFKAKYVDTGKVHYVFREMLVGGTGEMLTAASGFLLARCSGPGNYFKVTDAIFRSQPTLFDDPHTVLLNIAKSEGMSEAQFNACIQNEDSLKALQNRVDANATNGHINATPTFVINGVALDAGYHPLTDLDAAIAKAQAAKG